MHTKWYFQFSATFRRFFCKYIFYNRNCSYIFCLKCRLTFPEKQINLIIWTFLININVFPSICSSTHVYSHISSLPTKTFRKFNILFSSLMICNFSGTSGTQLLIQLWTSAWLNAPLSVSLLCGRSLSNEWIRMCKDNGLIGCSCNWDTFGCIFGVINACSVPCEPSTVRNFKSNRLTSTWQRYVANK